MTDDRQLRPRTRPIIWIALALTAAAIAAAVALVISRLHRKRPEPPSAGPQLLPPGAALELQGLSEDEAAARRLKGQDNAIVFKPPRSRREIWRSNIYTIFNLTLFGLMGVQILLGKYLDALLTVGVILLNIVLNVAQEMLARKRIKAIEMSTRAKATVIREGRARSIDPSEIVRGDLLVLGPGDQILVDGLMVGTGQVVVDESMLTGEKERETKSADDAVYAGSYCVAGRGAYEAYQVGDERLLVALTDKARPAKETLTPLEFIVDRVLRVLMGIVTVYTILFLIRYFRLDEALPVEILNDVASVIFNIAPASLFFMIILAYAAGTADLAKVGAMVLRARTVESMAETDTICFAQSGILTGTHVTLIPPDAPETEAPLAESRLRQILGDFARSTSMTNLLTQAMVSAFPGSRRSVKEEAPFLSVYGWSAVTFDDDDLQGIYVLGYIDALEPHLKEAREEESAEAPAGEDSTSQPIWRRAVSPLGRVFGRSRTKAPDNEGHPAARQAAPDHEGKTPAEVDSESPEEEETPRPGLFRRLSSRISSIVPRREAKPDEEEQTGEGETDKPALLFAFHPDTGPLHGLDRLPRLPDDLVPLCHLRYEERVRPEAIETVRSLADMGLGIKVFSSGSTDLTLNVLRQGDQASNGAHLGVISGPELAELNSDEFARAAVANTAFGYLRPEQAGQIVRALRQDGQEVAVVGDGVNDLPALQQANVAITRQGSSQAALSIADMIILEESPKALVRVLDKGQRIVNGLLDVLKLYLTQVTYLVLLVVSIPLLLGGFLYRSSQGSIVAIATTQLPAIALSLWAVGGVLPSRSLRWLLGRFVLPAGFTISLTVIAVYAIFLKMSGQVAYTQQAVTHTLVASGLLLVVFMKPPGRAWLSGGAGTSDWRFVGLALAIMLLFVGVTYIPLAQELLYLAPLNQLSDYGLVGLAVLVWGVVLQILWRLIPLDRKESP